MCSFMYIICLQILCLRIHLGLGIFLSPMDVAIPSTRLKCYTCNLQPSPKSCFNITECGLDQKCLFNKVKFPGVLEAMYRSSCVDTNVCDGILRLSADCLRCCDKDLCNNACMSSMSASTVTVNPKTASSIMANHVHVGGLSGQGIGPHTTAKCVDNPQVKCGAIKAITCSDPNTARLLCPKTCNMCGEVTVRSLATTTPTIPTATAHTVASVITSANSTTPTVLNYSSLVTAHPSVSTTNGSIDPLHSHICQDKPGVNCDPTVLQYLCSVKDSAFKLCRKSCNLCNVQFNTTATIINDCGDPIKPSMCRYLSDELCICQDKGFHVLCPHFCAGRCGPITHRYCNPQAIGRRKRDILSLATAMKELFDL